MRRIASVARIARGAYRDRMPIRGPTEAEREHLTELRQREIKASYGRGLPRLVVALVLVALTVGAVALTLALVD